ncbi:myb/SANT-like domain, Harbinger transposase-derived nuclease domain protein [Artemisia annua]|uniref:Myb/SANT-like domain, Harbinger transposase-derived nuclease domain protein n=1 Tax=Artemisia annua TaxID=35608 RepID=A0A2U1LXW1_ARTAN|nr:myb/SANT-like domain, Harbinger transposase-derived nuclease domain protein [Artemisia annua]
MGDTITLNFTPEQYKFFLDSCIEEVNRVDVKGQSLHVESWAIVGKKMKEKFGLATTQKQLKNKFDYYRGKHLAHAYLRGKTGNIFNADTNTFNLTDEEWRDLNKIYPKASSLKTSPLQHYDLCDYLFTKCRASGSIRRPVAERRPVVNVVEVEDGSVRRPVVEGRSSSQNFGVKVVEVEDDVNSFNEDGGYWAASEHRNVDASYDTSFEGGSSKEPNVARGRKKKRSKKDSELCELEENMKSAIAKIAVQENQGPTMEECHEKLKKLGLESADPIYLAALGVFCQSKSHREAWMYFRRSVRKRKRDNTSTMSGHQYTQELLQGNNLQYSNKWSLQICPLLRPDIFKGFRNSWNFHLRKCTRNKIPDLLPNSASEPINSRICNFLRLCSDAYRPKCSAVSHVHVRPSSVLFTSFKSQGGRRWGVGVGANSQQREVQVPLSDLTFIKNMLKREMLIRPYSNKWSLQICPLLRPDIFKGFRNSWNFHLRKCTRNKIPDLLPNSASEPINSRICNFLRLCSDAYRPKCSAVSHVHVRPSSVLFTSFKSQGGRRWGVGVGANSQQREVQEKDKLTVARNCYALILKECIFSPGSRQMASKPLKNSNIEEISESLYIQEQKPHEAIYMRSKVQKKLVLKLRALTKNASFGGILCSRPTKAMMERFKRGKIREKRRKEREMGRRLKAENAAVRNNNKITRDRDHEIIEIVALYTYYEKCLLIIADSSERQPIHLSLIYDENVQTRDGNAGYQTPVTQEYNTTLFHNIEPKYVLDYEKTKSILLSNRSVLEKKGTKAMVSWHKSLSAMVSSNLMSSGPGCGISWLGMVFHGGMTSRCKMYMISRQDPDSCKMYLQFRGSIIVVHNHYPQICLGTRTAPTT